MSLSKISPWIDRPEEIVYRSCYAPVDLNALLASSETRSKIRRLPLPQLFFGFQELDDKEVSRLLPHVTEEQWRGVLDLALWSRDRVRPGEFLRLQRHLLTAEDAVARKLLRASDPELWQLAFRRSISVRPRLEEDEFEAEPEEGREWMVTPDNDFLVAFPGNPEHARLLRGLLSRLYQLDPAGASTLLGGSRGATLAELEEAAYQARRRRMEDLGFQDYFDAISVYTPLPETSRLREKDWVSPDEFSLSPAPFEASTGGSLLLLDALSRADRTDETERLLEELFFVCNKVLSADRVSPADPDRVKKSLRKTVTGINFGLDCWSKGEISRALEGVRRYYFQSFFQMGYDRLLKLQARARQIRGIAPPQPGSLDEALLENLSRRYPMMVVQTPKGLRRRFIRTWSDLRRVQKRLDLILQSD